MKSFKSSRPSFARKPLLLAAALTTVASAMSGLPAKAATAPAMRDLGIVAPSMTIKATVWIKSSSDAAFDSETASLNDPSSASYHHWLQDADMAAYAPSAQDIATTRASLAAFGLNVDKVFDGGTLLRVSGSAAQLQAAFGTTIHAVQTGDGPTLFKAATALVYKGAHAELVGGVAGLTGTTARPLVVRQMNLASGGTAPDVVPQAGTDPLAAFTSSCFGSEASETMSGLGVTWKGKGPTYLDPTSTGTRPACGYTAQQLVAHYGIDEAQAIGLKGRGQTIVIVDAYGSPTALADLNTFSKVMNLPTMSADQFQVVYPDGLPSAADAGDWPTETSLDIEWAHAFAPEARIVLVISPTEDNAELAYAVEYAVDHHLGNVISNSWGLAEVGGDKGTAGMFNHLFKHAAARGVAVNVAAGDSGDNGVGTPVGAAGIPADSPFATSVGGTSIGIPSDDGPVEAAWGMALTAFGNNLRPTAIPTTRFVQGTGGGESAFLGKPAWQNKLPGTGRQSPDISALGDPNTGAITVLTDPDTGAPHWFVIGGTSLATPIFSAIWALADQAAGESLGQSAPVIAALPPFAIRDVLPIKANKHNTTASVTDRDVLTTYNPAQLFALDPTLKTGFLGALVHIGAVPFQGWDDVGFGIDTSLAAEPGWDNATGYGVPNGLLFIESARLFARNR